MARKKARRKTKRKIWAQTGKSDRKQDLKFKADAPTRKEHRKNRTDAVGSRL